MHVAERERAVLYSTLPQHVADRVIKGEIKEKEEARTPPAEGPGSVGGAGEGAGGPGPGSAGPSSGA